MAMRLTALLAMLLVTMVYFTVSIVFIYKMEGREESKGYAAGLHSDLLEPDMAEEQGEGIGVAAPPIAIVVICYNRPGYLNTTLTSLLNVSRVDEFDLYISQDGNETGMEEVIQLFPSFDRLHFWYNEEEWLRHDRALNRYPPYAKLSAHYHFMFTQLFDVKNYTHAIILEDDMLFSHDLLEYFQALLPVMEQDPSVLSISAWNDNGRKEQVADPKQLYRTSVFPGLGWIMQKRIWDEWRDIWPYRYWDDWIRDEARTKGRSSIYPEINRIYTIGKIGTSGGLFYEEYLRTIRLNQEHVDWTDPALTANVRNHTTYDAYLHEMISSSKDATSQDIEALVATSPSCSFRIVYKDRNSRLFAIVAKKFNIMPDFRGGVPRTSYRGIVPFRYRGARTFLVPADWDSRLSSAT